MALQYSTLKGALLEYIIRNLLKKCGFTNVKADDLYSFENKGLFFVNGKGAAHDADIIMNPPIQMPFIYPTQLIFECKAYAGRATLSVVRNASGLRNDLNDFEIVTKEAILLRKSDRRSSPAIESRTRYLYQVGVCTVNDFTNSAVEFAANNKIPLLSLSWLLNESEIERFNSIGHNDLANEDVIKNLYEFLKDRNGDNANKYQMARSFLETDHIISKIINAADRSINKSYVGLLETGDLVFLHSTSDADILPGALSVGSLSAEIHWTSENPILWKLTIKNDYHPQTISEYDFYVPDKIFKQWATLNLDKGVALQLKEQYFSKIFVFNAGISADLPFSVIHIDKRWLESIKRQQ